MPDITTIVACSTALSFIMGLAIVLSWLRDGRPSQRTWAVVPFAIAIPAGILLAYPDGFAPVLTTRWALRVGWGLILLVYLSGWQAARACAGRRVIVVRPLIACVGCAALSLTYTNASDPAHVFAMAPRIAMMALFNALIAREFGRIRAPELPSAGILHGIFACFALIDVLRLPMSLWLPAPLGPKPPETFAIIFYNMEIVMEGMLLGLFMTALGREQLTARHMRLALVDPLTGVGNRRGLDSCLEGLRRPPEDKIVALVTLDIDRFKTINDRFGHSLGDQVIIGAARKAQSVFGEDRVFRTGGEEFVALVESESLMEILGQSERLRNGFSEMSHRLGNDRVRATMSLGVACLEGASPLAANDWNDALARADEALYQAKRTGRDRTVIATDLGMLPFAVDELPLRRQDPAASSGQIADIAALRATSAANLRAVPLDAARP